MRPEVNKEFLEARQQARRVVAGLLEGASLKQFLAQDRDRPRRTLAVVADPSHDGYYQIPVLDYPSSRYVNLFKPETNPKSEVKERLQQLVRTRKGYRAQDLFQTPWGNFLVTNTLKIKEI